MSLLQEIQNLSIDGTSDLETLLRKCRILAARLKNEEFTNWVRCELDGYNGTVDLPNYRKLHTSCFGHFSGPGGRQLQNAPIAEVCIPAGLRKLLTHVNFEQGISSIKEQIRANEEHGYLRFSWPADTSPLFGNSIYDGMYLMQAWQLVNVSFLVAILSTVRNRILDFVLEIESANPEAGEAPMNSIPVPKDRVTQIFHQNIFGNVGNIASGHDIHQNATVSVNEGDLKSLTSYLEAQGIKSDDLQGLKTALNADGKLPQSGLGKSVSRWLGKMVQKSAEGTWEIGVGTAAGILTEALKAFYGL